MGRWQDLSLEDAAKQSGTLNTASTNINAAISEYKAANTALKNAWRDIGEKNGVLDDGCKALIATFQSKIPKGRRREGRGCNVGRLSGRNYRDQAGSLFDGQAVQESDGCLQAT